ncbi:unnamed protein product [Fraxinus pennsylvanica]|uniref:Uncharacterized protein n=1 Tax=Fraxinus pennsylvanica TaxID=56036 RepID=A0AAD2ECE7_9LAMI|nr:unnamed protein product [Fraxinus pennsylvanica]
MSIKLLPRVYKLEAHLYFLSPYVYYNNGSDSRYGSHYHRTVSRSGTIISNDLGYFEPISIYDFPYLSNYSYSLVTQEVIGGCYGDADVPENQSARLESKDFCSIFPTGTISVELEYATECKTSQNCTLFVGGRGYLPRFMHLHPVFRI